MGGRQPNPVKTITFESKDGKCRKEMMVYLKQLKVTDKLRCTNIIYVENDKEKKLGEVIWFIR